MTYISELMHDSINHLLAKYKVTDVTPKNLKNHSAGRVSHAGTERKQSQKSLPFRKVMFYENEICEAAGLFNVEMTQ